MRLLFIWVVAFACITQATVVDENGFIYNLLLRTGVVYPEDEPLVVADSSRVKRCRWKLCGTGRRFRFNRK